LRVFEIPFFCYTINNMVNSTEGGDPLEPNKEVNATSFSIGAVIIIMGVAASVSLHSILSHLNPWQAAGYALVAGIFIALVAAILNAMLSFFYDD
jgi:hypothetical protein